MGAYVVGLAALMLRHFPGRPMLVLRQRDDMAMETEVIERLREVDVDVRFLNVGNRSDFLSAVRFAQKGAVIVVFCDLDPSYGAPAEMPMFGLPFRFAFGTDTLARLTGATVVPVATTMDDTGDTVRLGQPFEVWGTRPRSGRRWPASCVGTSRPRLRRGPSSGTCGRCSPIIYPPLPGCRTTLRQAGRRRRPSRRKASRADGR